MLIAVAIGSRANFGSLRTAMLALRRRGARVVPVLFASALSDRFGNVPASLEHDGIIGHVRLCGMVDPIDMADTTGMVTSAWSRWIASDRPDVVLVCGDRHEVLGAATAAAYAGVRLVHTMGGEVSGNIDDRVRDAITALADEHCVATEGAAGRVRAMIAPTGYGVLHDGKLVGAGGGALIEYTGSIPQHINVYPNVHVTGCPRIDTCREAITDRTPAPIIMVSQHPVTTRTEAENESDMAQTLDAVEKVATERNLGVELFWPNADAGTEGTQRAIRSWLNGIRGAGAELRINTHRAMGPHDYARMMARCAVLVGNSSSGIREGAWIGTPVVNVGDRQRGREVGGNVASHATGSIAIEAAIRMALAHGPYPSSPLYGDGTAGEKVANVILGADEAAAKRRLEEGIRARL